jgi:hypothetical protein
LKRYFPLLRATAFWTGVLLLGLNVVGLCTGLRSDALYTRPRSKPWGPLPPASDLLAQINSYNGDTKDYVRRLTRDVSIGIRHYWQDDAIDEYHLRVPIQENYLLFGASFIRPDLFMKYEFTDYRKAVERGVGLCSQCVVIVAEVLKEKHIHSHIASLTEHVVVEAQVGDDEWWVLDPDYGVTIPYPLSAVQKDPTLIQKSYMDAGWTLPSIQNLERIYGQYPGTVYPGDGARAYHAKLWIVEELSYIMIWVIPLVLVLPQVITMYRAARSRRKLGVVKRLPIDHPATATTRNRF